MMKSTFPFEFKLSEFQQKSSSTSFLSSPSSNEDLNNSSSPQEISSLHSSLGLKSYNSDDEEALSHVSEPFQDQDSYDLVIRDTPPNPEKPFLNIEISRKTLKIDGKIPRKNRKDPSNLNGVKKLKVDFTEFSFNEGQIRQFTLTLKSLENVRKVKIIIRNQKEASIIQKQLDEIFSKLHSLKSVKFDFYRSGIASECVEYLSKEVIPKLKKGLKSFHINLYDSNITNENVQKLAWSLKEKFAELEDFKCNLGQTKVTEKVIIQLFHEMPKMKHFELNIGNCAWTDYGMKIFIRNTLKSMKGLESFTFLLEATDMMSAQIIELFRNLPETLKKLRLDLRWTRTTSESLKVFMNEKLPKLMALEEVELKVDCTLASKKMKEEIDGVNRRFVKKIDVEECLKYQQMIKEKYSSK